MGGTRSSNHHSEHCTRMNNVPQPDNTHKQLVGHNDGRVVSVHVDFDNVSVPRAIQQLIVWRRSKDADDQAALAGRLAHELNGFKKRLYFVLNSTGESVALIDIDLVYL